MRRAGVALSLAVAAATAGCGGGVPPAKAQAGAAAPGVDGRAAAIGLDEDVSRALERIAVTDPRFARRLATPPGEDELRASAVRALAEGDPDVSIRDGVLDFFSFTARARGLDDARKVMEGSPEPRSEPSAHARVAGAPIARPRLERELAVRLLAEERARLDEERSLPRGASALVRGIVETWSPPQSPQASAERDAWLSGRLDQIRGSLTGSALPRGALLELDDALDPLERLASPNALPSAARAIARLRVTLGETPSAPGSADGARQGRIEAALRAHLGLSAGAKELRVRLLGAEGATRALAKEASSHADERAISKRAEELTLSAGKCAASLSESRVRSMAPPSERAAICGSLRALASADDGASRAAAMVALHDATVVGLWALALHADGAPPERAIGSAHPFFGAQPEREARLVRFAEASPVAAIGAGLAAELLSRNAASAEGADAASKRWLAFGDAPLDVVERELFAGAAATGPTPVPAPVPTSGPARPASPRP